MATSREPSRDIDLFGPQATSAIAAPLLRRAEALIELRWQALILRREPPYTIGSLEDAGWHVAAETGRLPNAVHGSTPHVLTNGVMRNAVVIPLRHAGALLGVWVLGPKDGAQALEPVQIAALKRLAHGAAASIEVGIYRAWVASTQLASPQADAANQVVETLTAREQQVAALLVRGGSNQQIGRELQIKDGTVAKHIEHIMRKLDFQSRSQIAVWASEHGLSPA